MKSKAKLKKIKAQKTSVNPGLGGEWLYISDQTVSIRDLYQAVPDTIECEIWEMAGILEISIGEKASIDIENSISEPDQAISLGDPEGDDFLKAHNAKSLYFVSFNPENYQLAKPVMEEMVQKIGGFFCQDNQDFTPQI